MPYQQVLGARHPNDLVKLALAVPLGGDLPEELGQAGGGNVLAALGLALVKVALLAVLMFFVGGRVVPWLLTQVARSGSRELFTLAVLAVALGIAFSSAVVFDVSLALGAFLDGLVVSESDLSHQAAADALPLRDAFAVLFFVSAGMPFAPSFLMESPGRLLALLVIIVLGKALAALLIVVTLGYPVRTRLVVAAGLAQIGEFSFILAELGRALGLLPEEGHNLILAGAILSITLNPLLFRALDPIERWVHRRPRISALLGRRAGAVAALPEGVDDQEFTGHAVICGYDRVGSLIGLALRRQGFDYVVIEQNHRRVEELREQGIKAIYGEASNPVFLDHVNLAAAHTLVVATAEPLVTRQIVEHARRAHPGLKLVVRTINWEEMGFVRRLGIEEMELALEMAGYTLGHLGASEPEAQQTVRDIRHRVELGHQGQPIRLVE